MNASPSYPTRSLPWLRLRVRRFRVRDHPSLFPFLRRQLLETVRSSPYLHRVQVTLIRRIGNEGSFESAQQVVTELVEIQEVDPEVDDEEAQALSDAMDAEVRSRLYQRCKSKQHPHRFAPFPKGWQADRARGQRRKTFQRGGAERERFVRTRNL